MTRERGHGRVIDAGPPTPQYAASPTSGVLPRRGLAPADRPSSVAAPRRALSGITRTRRRENQSSAVRKTGR